uniref:Virion-associated protein n=1 Tax=Dahlia mosaic virus-Holland TaxID=480379 RepID=A9QKR5_9VIRU|nr:DNA binding protein [Dahlia mosaic virus-Holland]
MTTLATIKEISDETLSLVKELLTMIKQIIDRPKSSTQTELTEPIAAKIIKDISDKIDKCECAEKLKQELKAGKDMQVSKPEEPENLPKRIQKYSYPNWGVGNESLGSSGNPKALEWPPK